MIDWTWITTTATASLMVVLTALGIYLALILFTRLAGLRSFSKMSSFDFAVTVAFGSLLASTVLTKDPPLLRSVVALGTLYLIQYLTSQFRYRSTLIAQLTDNAPVLLMAGPEILYDNLAKVRMTEDDLRSKLREANVIHREQVRAVVMEATGDVSVLHADPDGPDLELSLLASVRGTERLKGRPNVKSPSNTND